MAARFKEANVDYEGTLDAATLDTTCWTSGVHVCGPCRGEDSKELPTESP
ncbi:MAG TPA: hypothetical protein VG675_08725 [Bryobacteraceae bacterium]|nr:hypothetical protein [Bryobacteraceae bacterium]